MHNSDDYETCMITEAAEQRVYNKLVDLREEIRADWEPLYKVWNYIRENGNQAVEQINTELKYGLPFITHYVW